MRYSKFKPGMSAAEIANAFNVWFQDCNVFSPKADYPPHIAFTREFEAFKAGMETDSIPVTPQPIPKVDGLPAGNSFVTYEFPQAQTGSSILQYRPYDKDYNEAEISIGMRVSIWKTEEHPIHEADEIRGTISGIRRMSLSSLPTQHQNGILNFYLNKGLDLTNGDIFVFWVDIDPPQGSFSSYEDFYEERHDITDD